MEYRVLGKTNLKVSEIGFGAEWLCRHDNADSIELVKYAHKQGVNILDLWKPDPKSRDIVGEAIKDCREEWFIQGHVGATWQNEQYVRTRDMSYVIPAFEDLLERLHTDYIDLGMIHYVDSEEEWDRLQDSDYMRYIFDLKEKGVIRHIGLSSHNPKVAVKAARTDFVEMIMFSLNPAFDMMHSSEDILDDMLSGTFAEDLKGIDPERAEFYKVCEENNVGIVVMKGYAGGRLFDANQSPFGVALTPVHCIHYALTRPSVGTIVVGYDTIDQIDQAVAYETATDEEKEYTSIIVNAPLHSYKGQCTYCGHCAPCPVGIDVGMVNKFYDLAIMQDSVPDSIQSHYELLDHHASECIGCKGCETRCPFSVSVAARMKKTADLFGV